MTLPTPYGSTPSFTVELLAGKEAYERFRADIAAAQAIYSWAYLIEPVFFRDLFDTFLQTRPLSIIADARQKRTLRELATTYNRLHPAIGTSNRTLHDKTFLFPHEDRIWIGTHNLTRGSWTLSNNRAARITHPRMAAELFRQWAQDYGHTRPALPLQRPRH